MIPVAFVKTGCITLAYDFSVVIVSVKRLISFAEQVEHVGLIVDGRAVPEERE
jgi:hypothetical protein